jgi:hypothetical protein
MQADISGAQRKILTSSVRPAQATYGAVGIPLQDGHTLPFVVERGWSAPAGTYSEAFYLVDPSTREVLYDSGLREEAIWGLQALTDLRNEVTEQLTLAPGQYRIVFSLGGIQGGELDIEAFEVAEEAA